VSLLSKEEEMKRLWWRDRRVGNGRGAPGPEADDSSPLFPDSGDGHQWCVGQLWSYS
jgi:hypothetical protein